MSDILTRAKLHYRDRLAEPLRFVEVEEWPDENGEPSRIYYRQSMSLQQQQEVLSLNQAGKVGEALVATLIAKALDADGKALFRQVHRTELMRNVDTDVISKIIQAMNDDEGTLTDDEIKNS